MVLLISINSKYIHNMPSPYYLKEYCGGNDISVLNFNVNMPLAYMTGKICNYNPQVIGFSCYIFNIDTVKRLADAARKIFPSAKIVFGGPEASYDSSLLAYCDTIICGEGEQAFKEYLKDIFSAPKIICGKPIDMDSLPDIYGGKYLEVCKNGIIYYESSRGCPYSCSYCMSSVGGKVRYKSLDKVFSELKIIAEGGVKQVKFIDRTFNSNLKRAEDIFSHIIKNYSDSGINFHFEMSPLLFDEAMFKTLSTAKRGLFQFEIGVQTFNKETLAAINRSGDVEKAAANIGRLLRAGNIHIHADLIAGLPLEGYKSFADGFDKLYNLKPDNIQLGFLKVLKGSPMSEEYQKYGIKFSEFPPYEVLGTAAISPQELSALKNVENLCETFYNSSKFRLSMEYLSENFSSPFNMFEQMADYFRLKGYFDRGISYNDNIEFLYEFGAENAEGEKMFKLLKEDFERQNHGMNLLPFFKRAQGR